MNRSLRVCAILMVVASFGTGLANAAVITAYTTLASWQAAAGAPIATEDFTDTTLVPGLSVSLAGGGSISGGMISSSLAVFGLCVDGGTNCPATTSFGFSPATTAFAADWDLSPGGPGAGIFFSVHLQGGAVQTVTGFTNPATGTFSGFYGFVSDTPIVSINLGSGFTGNGELFNADNVRFRTASTATTTTTDGSVPEPSSLILLGAGLMGVAKSRAFKRTFSRRQASL